VHENDSWIQIASGIWVNANQVFSFSVNFLEVLMKICRCKFLFVEVSSEVDMRLMMLKLID